MSTIQIRSDDGSAWVAAEVLAGERPGFVEVSSDAGTRWVRWEDVHPADQVLLTVERQARQRYAFVPPEDRVQPQS